MRRKRLNLKRILKEDGSWAEGETTVAIEALKFYEDQFTESDCNSDKFLLQHIASQVTVSENLRIKTLTSKEEVKKVIFELSGDSTSGLDGFTGHFYQHCWDIVCGDILKVVQAFFKGGTLPKSVIHTNLVLLPKKAVIQLFSDLRPTSVNNFLKNVISSLLHERIESLLPKLISPNQTGFVKGRNITGHSFLAQEIIMT